MITRAIAEKQLALWLTASEAVAQNQSYTIATESGSRTLTRANAESILKQIQFWEQQLRQFKRQKSGISVRGHV
jgi:hypothetical protein